MREYRSFLKEIIGKFIDFMIASQHWCDTYARDMKRFDGYLFSNYPEETELTQEIVDSWCRKRPKESVNSCLARHKCCRCADPVYEQAGPDKSKRT